MPGEKQRISNIVADAMDQPRGRGRPPDRRGALIRLLRRQIVQGKYGPGDRLPSRASIMEEHGLSSVTVQRTFDRLSEDGFVVSYGKGGTRVSKYLPHLCAYGIVFAGTPGDTMHWRGLDRALASVAGKHGNAEPLNFRQYQNTVYGELGGEIGSLVDDMKAHRLAGAILTSGAIPVWQALKGHFNKFPIVEITTGAGNGLPSVVLDARSFFARAIACLHEQGARRVAIVTGVQYPEDALNNAVSRILPEYGITTHPYWIHQFALTDPVSVRRVMHLMMQSNQLERPDGLVIADDNLTEQALAGIADAGAGVPGDIKIVSHANFPLTPRADVPVRWIGFPAQTILEACCTLIDERRTRGKFPTGVVKISVVDEREFKELKKKRIKPAISQSK